MIDVEILLQKADIGVILNRLGIDFDKRSSKRGHELYFCCPTANHPNDPTKKRVSISDAGKYKGMFNCWACDFKGNLIHLIRYITKWEFNQAITFLENDYGSADVAGIEALQFRLKMNKSSDEEIVELPEFELPKDFRLITKCVGEESKKAYRWLSDERNITKEMMDKFEIGMCYHVHLGVCIVLPVYFKGKLNSIFYAQPFTGGVKRYPKNSPQGYIMFNYDRCFEQKRYVMMESILDVIKYESVVGEPAMACFTNMISDEQIELLRNFEEHCVMPDLDGNAGWALVTRMLPFVGKGLWLQFPPLGKDPGDCTPDELISARKERLRYCDYEVNQWAQSKQTETPVILTVRK